MSDSRVIEPVARPSVLHGVALDLQPRELGRARNVAATRESARMTSAELQAGDSTFASGDAFEAARHVAIANAEAHMESLRQARAEGYQDAVRDLKQQGQQAGFEQGLKEGTGEGRILGKEEVLRQAQAGQMAAQARMERLDQWLDALQAKSHEHLTQRLEAAEDELIAIAHAVICRMLGDAAFERASVSAMVRMAVEQCCGSDAAGSSTDVTAVHVNPHDLETLQQDPSIASWLAQRGASDVRWVPEPKMELGGCMVQSAQGNLDARLETQLTALRHVLIESRGGVRQ